MSEKTMIEVVLMAVAFYVATSLLHREMEKKRDHNLTWRGLAIEPKKIEAFEFWLSMLKMLLKHVLIFAVACAAIAAVFRRI